MRPVVAIVSARPETIADDYRRLLDLAGLGCRVQKENSVFALEARQGGGGPGQVCPPWQVEALLKCLAESGDIADEVPDSDSLMVAVKDSGPSAHLRGFGWDDVLQRYNQGPANADTLAVAPLRPAVLLPSLEAVLPRGFQISPHLRGKDLFLLSAMSIEPGGILAANVALVDSLLAADRKTGGKIPMVEVLTEVMGLAREVFSSMAVVTDATVVSVVRRGGLRVPLVRNLLIAGSDPVAVDAVLARLAGLQPASAAWLKLCQDRGLGVADLAGMRIVGETQWLDLDFQIPEDTFASGNTAERFSPGNLWSRLAGQRGGGKAPLLDSAWERLYRDYQSGVTS